MGIMKSVKHPISSKRSSSASSVNFCIIKLTLASLTPSIFRMASSTFAAQLAQSISHLNFFFIIFPSSASAFLPSPCVPHTGRQFSLPLCVPSPSL